MACLSGCAEPVAIRSGNAGPSSASSEPSQSQMRVDGVTAYGEEDVEPPPEDRIAFDGECGTTVTWEWGGDGTDSAEIGVDPSGSGREVQSTLVDQLAHIAREYEESASQGPVIEPDRLAELEEADAAPNRFPIYAEEDRRVAEAVRSLEVTEASIESRTLTSSDGAIIGYLALVDDRLVLAELTFPDTC